LEAVTAQGSPRSIFKRAIERGNVVVAEATARKFALTLDEALQLVLLYAAYEPAKLERAALGGSAAGSTRQRTCLCWKRRSLSSHCGPTRWQ
jgi:hypothetical protein